MDAKIVAWMIAQVKVRVTLYEFNVKYKTNRKARDGLTRLVASGLIVRWDDGGVETLTLTDRAARMYGLTMHVETKPDRSEVERWVTPDKPVPRTKLAIKMKKAEPVTLEADFRSKERANGMDSFVNPADCDPAEIIEAYEAIEERIVQETVNPLPKPVEINLDPVNVISSAKTRTEAERLNDLLRVYGKRHPSCDEPVREKFAHPYISMTGVRPWPVEGMENVSQGPKLPLLPRGGVNKLPRQGAIPIDGDRPYDGPCPSCKNKYLELWEECLVCDRSGIDHKLERVWPERTPKVVPDKEGLVGGVGAGRGKQGKKGRKKKRTA